MKESPAKQKQKWYGNYNPATEPVFFVGKCNSDRSDTNWSRDFEPSELTSNTDTPTTRIVLSDKAILTALIYNLEPTRDRWHHLTALIYNWKVKEVAEALIPATDEVPKTV